MAKITGSLQDDTIVGGYGVNDSLNGAAGNDVLYGYGDGSGIGGTPPPYLPDSGGPKDNDTLFGGIGADTLFGGGGNDRLDGGAGADSMDGGDQDDVYFVDDLGDIAAESNVDAYGGTDRVNSSVTHTLGNGIENLTLTGKAAINGTGNALNNAIIGTVAANVLRGNDGADTLDGGGGADTQFGGLGNDVYTVDDKGDVISESGGDGIDTLRWMRNVSLDLNSGSYLNIENAVLLGNASVSLNGTAGDNGLGGNAGNNTIDGGGGYDTMAGGGGNDTYIVDGGDFVFEAAGGGTDHVISGASYSLSGEAIENLTLTGTATTGTGNTLGNKITGNASDNTLDGDAGADSLIGADGLDSLIGGADNDTLDGGIGDDTLTGGAGIDSMIGGAGNDKYVVDVTGDLITEAGGGGIDSVESGATTYTLSANVENLLLTGTANINGIGSVDANTITGNSGNNSLSGAGGADTLIGGGGLDTLLGGDADDSLSGGLANDSLLGDAGNDKADGGDGDDTLGGGAGTNTLIGGIGDDVYLVDTAGNTLTENKDEGSDEVRTTVDLTLAANIEDLTLLTGALNGTGNDLNNLITGNAANNSLDGGIGDDTMVGGDGNDIYVVDSASDVVTEAGTTGSASDEVKSLVSIAALANNVENLTLLGTGNLNGAGNALANIITGNTGNNSLSGGGANDTLLGSDGDDTLEGEAGDDSMVGGIGDDHYLVDSTNDLITEAAAGGTDTVETSATYTISGNIENLILLGAANINGIGSLDANSILGNTGNNQLLGKAGADTLDGGVGNDTLDGGTEIDKMTGGVGNDVYMVDSTSDVTTENDGEGTDEVQTTVSLALLADNIENLTLLAGAVNGTGNTLANIITGNAAANSLAGAAGNDNLIGDAGNDTLDGGLDIDTLTGGDGNDLYIVDDAADKVTESGTGTDEVKASVTYSIAALGSVENLTLTGTGNFNGTGNALANIITGNTGNNSLLGGGANDSLVGGDGSDTLQGDDGIDTLVGGLGDDRYIVDVTGDIITELSGAGSGTDTVESKADFTLGGNLENLILTGTDNLKGTGNADNNTITGNTGNNSLSGAGGADTVFGGGGIDSIFGGDANDSLLGDAGNDSLFGDAGDDTLTGGDGNDTLSGDAGSNKLVGGLGDDTYIINAATDKIFENKGEGTDTVNINVTFSLGGNTDFAEIENLVLEGTDNINGTGNALGNRITGNKGNNVLNGGGGNDTLLGGLGDDTYFVDDGNDVITELAGQGIDAITAAVSISLAGLSEIENIQLFGGSDISATGSDTDNKIIGNDGKNTLSGGNGNDTLVGDGDNNADTLIGGAGDDVFFIEGSSLDTVSDSGGIDTVKSTKSFTLAKGIEIGIFIGTTNVEITGTSGKDSIEGGAENDTLNGLGNADTMVGHEGDDTYFVDNVGDVVVENPGEGNDTIKSTISFDLSKSGANVEILTLLGTGSINGTGNELKNTITGTNGNNILDGGLDDDSLIGGKGNDTYIVDSTNDKITEGLNEGIDHVKASFTYALDFNLENLTLTGTDDINGTGNADANVITGNSGKNVLTGGFGKDTLNGGGGDDTLIGGDTLSGDGPDVMAGGDGNDTYIVDQLPTFDTVVEAAGKGNDTVQLLILTKGGYTLGANVENLEFIGNGLSLLIGNGLNNKITGGKDSDHLIGGAGADTMTGGDGDDLYEIDSKLDVVIEADDGDVTGDTLFTPFSVKLNDQDDNFDDLSNFEHVILKQFTPTAVYAIGNDSANKFTGNNNNNLLDGGKNNDTLIGNTGADTEIGGLGDDVLHYDNVKDVLTEKAGEGNDTVQSLLTVDLVLDPHFANIENIDLLGTGALKAFGTDDVNAINGNLGANFLDGRGGNDTIFGGSGNDTIEGGLGDDSMIGGLGNDLYFVDTKGDTAEESTKGQEGIDTVQSKVDFTLAKYVDHLTLVEGSAAVVGIGNDGDGTFFYRGDNIIIGNSNANKLSGLGGNDNLAGNANADTLDGGAGIDVMTGGTGDDVYIVDDTKDKVVEGTDPGHDRVESKATFVLTANVEDLVLTGIDDINGTGNALKNDITGNSGDNVLDGLAGPDTMHGGLGDDTYVLDDVSKIGDLLDVVDESGGGGSDTLKTGMRSIDLDADTAIHVEWTDLENVWLTGTKALNASGDDGDNKLTGNTAANRLEGRDGNDTMDGGAGIDTMIGGKGNDTYTIDNIKDVIDESGGDGIDTVSSFVTYTLADGFENITLLGKANINATGSSLANVIVGNDGNNIIDGLTNADDMTGGKGNDTYIVDVAGDKVHETALEGTDTVKSIIDFSLETNGQNVENLTLLGAAKNGEGNATTNTILGNGNDNFLQGLAGNDNLTGGDGNDTLDGGGDNDIMNGGKGDDVFFIDSKSDKVIEAAGQGIDTVKSEVTHTLGGAFENLTLLDDGDEDTTENGFGNGGNNIIIGNSENNFIDGLGGNDTMRGEGGNDTYRINSKLDVIQEDLNEGTDTVQSGITIDALAANVENVFLFGTAAINATGNNLNNRLDGSFGANHLFGLGGDDILAGKGGNDILTGGDGRDAFTRVKVDFEGVDTITDFQVGTGPTGDYLDITEMLTDSKGNDIFNEVDPGKDVLSDFVRVQNVNGNTLVQVDANGGHNSFVTVFVIQGQTLTQEQVEAQVLTEHLTA